MSLQSVSAYFHHRGLFETVFEGNDTQINRVGKHKVLVVGEAKLQDMDDILGSLDSSYRLGAIRISFGLPTNFSDIERFISCISKLLDDDFQQTFIQHCATLETTIETLC
jgi:selenocysteine lyase/cysteine desulfurase